MRRAYENLIIERVFDSLARPPPVPVVLDGKSRISSKPGLRSLSSIDDETEMAEVALMHQIETLTAQNIELEQQVAGLKVSLGVGTVRQLQDALPMLLEVPAEAKAATTQAVRSIMHVLIDWTAKPSFESEEAKVTSPNVQELETSGGMESDVVRAKIEC